MSETSNPGPEVSVSKRRGISIVWLIPDIARTCRALPGSRSAGSGPNTLHQKALRGAKDQAPCDSSTQARALDTRKQAQPTTFGVQTSRSCSSQLRPLIMASPVSMLEGDGTGELDRGREPAQVARLPTQPAPAGAPRAQGLGHVAVRRLEELEIGGAGEEE